jgi:hypothetical protein
MDTTAPNEKNQRQTRPCSRTRCANQKIVEETALDAPGFLHKDVHPGAMETWPVVGASTERENRSGARSSAKEIENEKWH